jgi:hypothetical protein
MAEYLDTRKSMGKREDGSEKGTGWLGLLKKKEGGYSTEISIDVSLDGKKTAIPLLNPLLNEQEMKYILDTPMEINGKRNPKFMDKMPQTIINKAIDHATMRLKQGKSPFKERNEEFE